MPLGLVFWLLGPLWFTSTFALLYCEFGFDSLENENSLAGRWRAGKGLPWLRLFLLVFSPLYVLYVFPLTWRGLKAAYRFVRENRRRLRKPNPGPAAHRTSVYR